MEDFSLTLIWLGFFASVFFGWYFFLQARNKERMALIEKNAELPGIFKTPEARFHFPWLKLGMIITGTGLGFCIALITGQLSAIQYIEPMIFGCMLLFGGLGMVIAHLIEKPKGQ
jgi:hypothetical protein